MHLFIYLFIFHTFLPFPSFITSFSFLVVFVFLCFLIYSLLIGFFNRPVPSSLTMALGSTQPLTEMSTRNLPCGVKAAVA
jgi:hypothetical protein